MENAHSFELIQHCCVYVAEASRGGTTKTDSATAES